MMGYYIWWVIAHIIAYDQSLICLKMSRTSCVMRQMDARVGACDTNLCVSSFTASHFTSLKLAIFLPSENILEDVIHRWDPWPVKHPRNHRSGRVWGCDPRKYWICLYNLFDCGCADDPWNLRLKIKWQPLMPCIEQVSANTSTSRFIAHTNLDLSVWHAMFLFSPLIYTYTLQNI